MSMRLTETEINAEAGIIASKIMKQLDGYPPCQDDLEGAFIAGAEFVQSKLLEKAGEEFYQYFQSATFARMGTQESHLQTWSAAKLNAFRDVSFTNEQYQKLMAENEKLRKKFDNSIHRSRSSKRRMK
jgi:hypothetical protein